MSKWRKRPVVIDAVQIPQSVDSDLGLIPLLELVAEAESDRNVEVKLHSDGLVEVLVSSLEGDLRGIHPDWLVVGTHGEPYVVAGNIFPEIYEAAEAEYDEDVAAVAGTDIQVWVTDDSLQQFLTSQALAYGRIEGSVPNAIDYLQKFTHPDDIPLPSITVKRSDTDEAYGRLFTLRFPEAAE